MMEISIVIPTFNRNEQLSRVLDCILSSNVEDFSSVEVIVVDDGSPESAGSVVASKQAESPFILKYFFQHNAGPAEARNHGFREAKHEIVLFIDDDILVFPDLIRKHTEAHAEHRGSVIFGQSPYAVPETSTPAYRYLVELNNQGLAELKDRTEGDYIRLETIASGNISFEKSMFADTGEVYGSDLTIPVGEEFELALRLRQMKIPIYMMPETKGWHLQPATIKDCCIQNYKYGLGIAEVVKKNPEILAFEPVARVYFHNRTVRHQDPLSVKAKKRFRRMLAPKPVRGALLSFINAFENNLPEGRFLHSLYRLVISTHFTAGLRDGVKRFKNAK